MNKSEIYLEDLEGETSNSAEDQQQQQQYQQINHHHNFDDFSSQPSTSSSSSLPRSVTLVCVYDDVIKSPKDQIKWYFNKHRIRNSLDEQGGQIKILSGSPPMMENAAAQQQQDDQLVPVGQFSSSFSPNHHFTITQSLGSGDGGNNVTVSSLTIHNFNLKYNYGRYRCQYKGLVKTVKIYPNHKNGEINRFNLFFKSYKIFNNFLFCLYRELDSTLVQAVYIFGVVVVFVVLFVVLAVVLVHRRRCCCFPIAVSYLFRYSNTLLAHFLLISASSS